MVVARERLINSFLQQHVTPWQWTSILVDSVTLENVLGNRCLEMRHNMYVYILQHVDPLLSGDSVNSGCR
jgi:hypothetical protein